jgi:hypothetical protein
MKPNVRDAVLGVIAIVTVIGIIGFAKRSSFTNPQTTTPFQTSTPTGTVKGIEDTFKQTIPQDMDKKELKDVSNEQKDYQGIASRKIENNKTDVLVLADLPTLGKGETYNAVIVKDNGETKDLGNLTETKGGYMIETAKNENLSEFKTIRILRSGKTLLEASW